MYADRCGWIDWNDRTAETNRAHEEAVGAMPAFNIMSGSTTPDDVKKVLLTDAWEAPEVVAALGFAFPRIHQLTGSCVGAGAGNAVFTLGALQVLAGSPEQLIIPFWLFNYGRSRLLAGMRGRGEGSAGSTMAKSLVEDGIVALTHPGLPQPTQDDGLVWTRQEEMAWSDGRYAPADVVAEAKQHLIKTAAPMRSAADVRAAIRNGYPCTDACSGYVGRASIEGSGADQVCIGDIDSRGGHQTSIQGVWDHPQFGLLFNYQNNWPASVYPKDPAGGKAASCWITERRMNWICAQGEVYALSGEQGYPAQDLTALLRVMG